MDPTDYVARLFHLESGGDPNAQTGSNRGLGQFGPSEEAQYGINDSNRTSYDAQSNAVLAEMKAHGPRLFQALGREPTPGEYYLSHQQGATGGPALLSADANTPAWQALRPYYGSDAVAQRAITGNIPRGSPLYGRSANDISAGDFRNYWINKFENGGALSYAPTSGSRPMADDNTQGALSTSSFLGPNGALSRPGGIGDTLQNIGAWMQMPYNPAGAAATLNTIQQRQVQNRPQLQEIGTDPISQMKKFAVWNPLTQQFSRIGTAGTAANGLPGGTGSNSSVPDLDMENWNSNLAKYQNGQMSREQFTAQSHPMVRQMAQEVLSGQADPQTWGVRGMGATLKPLAITLAGIMDPNFQVGQIKARNAYASSMLNQLDPNHYGGQVLAADAFTQHMHESFQAQQELERLQAQFTNNHPSLVGNALSNAYNDYIKNDPYYQTVRAKAAAANGVAGKEAAKIIVGGRFTEADRLEMAGYLGDGTKTGAQYRGGANALIQQVYGRLQALGRAKQNAFGGTLTDGTELLSPDSRDKFNYLRSQNGNLPGTPVTKPSKDNRPPISTFFR